MKADWSDWAYRIIPGLLLLLFFFNGLNDAVQNSAVADEVAGHLASGYLYWGSGVYSGGVVNLPLPHLLISLPVVLLGRTYELFTEQHLVLFRLPVLLMGVALAIVLYRFAAGLFDRKAALAALFLFSFSPNILSHSSLATLDLPVTFFVFLTVYALWRYVERPHWSRMLALSLALGCALTTKVQAYLLIPIVVLVLFMFSGRLRPYSERGAVAWWSWLFLPVVPWLVINIVYLNSALFSGHVLPPSFVRALELKLLHATGSVQTGQIAYLCGRLSADGWWYYFPFAILVKTPLPTLVLLGLGLRRNYTRDSLLFLALPAAAFLGVAMTAKLNIGLRHVLVIYPFLFLYAGKGAASLWNRSWRGAVLMVLAAWYLWQAAAIAPHHLSFFNVAAGGPRNGHKLLIDSNYDWGQNDRFLRRCIEERGRPYKIDPDPFRPTTGHIVVNANAFYGYYGAGGPAAYAWLKRFERLNQIAYTWFEYDIPEDAYPDEDETGGRTWAYAPKTMFRPWNRDVDPLQREAALEQVDLHLRGLRRRYDEITDPDFRLHLGMAFISTASYETVLDEMRFLLQRYPDCEPALGVAGELMVGWKLGTLDFEGDEYLTGFRDSSVEVGETLPDLESVGHLAQQVGISAPISNVHYQLGTVLERQGRIRAAIEQYYAAVEIEPANWQARRSLTAAQARVSRH